MRTKISDWIVLLQIPLDIISVTFAFVLAFVLKTRGVIGGLEYVPGYNLYFPFVLLIIVFQIIVFFSSRLYSFEPRTFLKETGLLVYACFLWTGIILAMLFIWQQFFFSRLLLVTAIVIFFLSAFFSRLLLRGLRRFFYKHNIGVRGVVLIGSQEEAFHLVAALDDLPGFKLLGFIKENDFASMTLEEVFAQFYDRNHELQVHEVWNTLEQSKSQIDEIVFDFCADRKITYRYTPNFFASSSKRLETMLVGDFPLVEVLPTPLKGWGKVLKRAFDIILSLLALFLLSPIFLIIAILVKIITPGPVFVGLKRVGYKKYKEPFVMYKFRSMIVGAHAMKPQLMALNERTGGPLFKLKNDPRITPLGKYLRKLRLDELPQLWNVLRGEMSLVGPRAHEPEEVAKYSQKQLRLLRVKPGMTGMGQVSGASDLSFDEEVKLETYYIQNWSVFLDLQILIRTVWAVIKRKGAV